MARVRSTGRAAASVGAAAIDASTASGGVPAAVRRYRCLGFGAHAGGSPRGQSHRLVRGNPRRVVSFFFILVCAIGLTSCFVCCYRVFGEDGADAALREFLSDGLERFDAKTKRTYAEHGGGGGNNDDGSGPKASTDRYKQSPFRIQLPNYHLITT